MRYRRSFLASHSFGSISISIFTNSSETVEFSLKIVEYESLYGDALYKSLSTVDSMVVSSCEWESEGTGRETGLDALNEGLVVRGVRASAELSIETEYVA